MEAVAKNLRSNARLLSNFIGKADKGFESALLKVLKDRVHGPLDTRASVALPKRLDVVVANAPHAGHMPRYGTPPGRDWL